MTGAYHEIAESCQWDAGPSISLDEWQILWSLFTSQDPRQQEQLCSDLLQLPAARINRYLLEYVYLAVSRPGGPLERAIAELCGRSFNTAVQVSWLLLALLQDQPGNQHIRQLKDECEMAALMGGVPSHPHYSHLHSKQQLQQHELASLESQQKGQDADSGLSNLEGNCNTPASSHSSAASTPFATSANVTPFSSISPASSPSAAAAAAASFVGSVMSSGSLSSSHRFRDSLDLELMRQTSHQDLCAAMAAAASSRAVSPSPGAQQQQQQSVSAVPSQLPPIRTISKQLDRSTSNSSSKSPKHHTGAISIKNSKKSSNRKSDSKSSRKVKPIRGSSIHSASSSWAVPGSAAAAYSSFDAYLTARRHQLESELGVGEGVSGLIAASHEVELAEGQEGCGWLVSHEEEPLSASLLLAMPPRWDLVSDISTQHDLLLHPAVCYWCQFATCQEYREPYDQSMLQLIYKFWGMVAATNQGAPAAAAAADTAADTAADRSPRHAAGRDSYLATLDFVDALCETSSNLTRFQQDVRRKVLRQCLYRINQEVEDAADQGVAVRYPIGKCSCRVLRLLVNEAVILNSRDKAPFLLLAEVQHDDDFVDEALTRQKEAVAAEASAVMATGAVGVGVSAADADAVGKRRQSDQQQPVTEPVSPHRSAAAAQMHRQQQQQQRHKRHNHDVTPGQSPLGRDASRDTTAAATAASPLVTTGAEQHQKEGAAAAAAAASNGNTSDAVVSAPHICSAASEQDVSQAKQQQHHGNNIQCDVHDDQLHHQQQQQQQSEAALHSASNGHTDSGQQPPLPQYELNKSSNSSSGSSGNTINTPTNAAAAAAAVVRSPSPLEQQMQEAIAHFKGDPDLKVVTVKLRITNNDELSSDHDHRCHQILSKKDQELIWQQQQQRRNTRMRALQNGESTAASGRKSRSMDDSVLVSGLRNHTIRDYSTRDDSSLISHESQVDGPWLFGEMPAQSATSSWCRDNTTAAATGAGRNNSGDMQACDRAKHPPQQQQPSAAAADDAVSVDIEVIPTPVVVQQLMHCPKLLLRRKARRMPSVEAIDIIAGKLGSSIPPPTEIGPPLRVSISSSISSSSTDDHQSVDQDESGLASPASTTAASTDSDEPDDEDDDQQPSSTADAAAAAAGSDSGTPVYSHGDVTRPAARAALYAQHAGHEPAATSSSSSHVGKSKGGTGCQDQQQQSAGSRWWSLLWNPLAGWQQTQPSQQQQEKAGQVAQLQQQQQDGVDVGSSVAEVAAQAAAVYGERWNARTDRIRAGSSVSTKPGWSLSGLIVKSGDDCRQELLALQLIRGFGDIWAAAGLPLWVRHFEVLVTSNNTALIELIPDATSIHSIKARSSSMAAAKVGTPHGGSSSGGVSGTVSLSDHFFAKWQRGSAECIAAQRRFVESLAGYSLITYLLQVKDRHNGNIMLDDAGRLIHIDFGFMLSNAPGGNWVRFEAAPFKLTREMLEVMDTNTDGQPSELFDYFKVLCIQGFLVARRHRHLIVGLVKVMAECSRPAALHPPTAAAAVVGASSTNGRQNAQSTAVSAAEAAEVSLEERWQGSPTAAAGTSSIPGSSSSSSAATPAAVTPGPIWPCFQAGPERVVASLESRFAPHLSEGQCVQHVLRLIGDSLDAWSTRQYDFYQRVLNGIL